MLKSCSVGKNVEGVVSFSGGEFYVVKTAHGPVTVSYAEVDPSADSQLDRQSPKHWLVGRVVRVIGQHPYKGMEGFVTSVNIVREFALVNLSAQSVHTGKAVDIPLVHLALDLSSDV